jgi:hypothetical protein
MRFLLISVVGSLAVATGALAQTSSTTPPAPTADSMAPVAMTSRVACRAASQSFTGQDRHDQMQLCMAQAHLDCLKQAIDQKIVGPQRMDYLKNCTGRQ